MCAEVAGKAYPGEEASPTGRAEVGRRRSPLLLVGVVLLVLIALALRAARFCSA